jgi:hypothetical protein
MVALLLAISIFGVERVDAQPGLVPNANVETDGDANSRPDMWFSSSGVSYPDDNGPSSPGTKSIQLDSAGQDWRSSTAPVVPGGKYMWSFDYKFLEGATGEFRADLRFFDGGTFKGEDAPLFAVSNIGQWQTSSRMATAPSFAPDNPLADNVLDVRLSSNLFAPGNGLVRFDNIIVQFIPEPSTAALLAVAGLFTAWRRTRKGAP